MKEVFTMAKKKVETVDEVQEVKQDVAETAEQEATPKKRTRKTSVDAEVTAAPEAPAVAETVKESSDAVSEATVDEPAEQLVSEDKADDTAETKPEKPAKAKSKKSAKSGYAVGTVIKTDLARLFANSVAKNALRPVAGEFVICVEGEHDGRVAISENGEQIGWISVEEIKK